MEFVTSAGGLVSNPEARPPTVESAREVIIAAAATYEEGNSLCQLVSISSRKKGRPLGEF